MRKLFLLAVIAVAAVSAATRGSVPAASPDKPVLLTDAVAATPAASSATAPADRPVLLADAQEFEARPAPEIGWGEIAEARRMLASAVASEKFADGAVAVVVVYLFYLFAF